MRVFAHRAAAILDGLLGPRQDPRPFLIPANVCPVVVETFDAAGQAYELVDIGGDDLALDRDLSLERLEKGSCGGIVFVRTYGVLGDAAPFFQAIKARQPDLLVIDDRCLCRPDWEGEADTPGADVTLYSTGYGKYLDLQYGGFAHLGEGIAYRAEPTTDRSEELFPRLLAHMLPKMDEHKRRLNGIYAAALPQEIQFPPELQSWRFHIRVPNPDFLIARLVLAGLFASRHYPALGDFPVAQELHRNVVNLFNDWYYTEEQARTTCEVVRAHLMDG